MLKRSLSMEACVSEVRVIWRVRRLTLALMSARSDSFCSSQRRYGRYVYCRVPGLRRRMLPVLSL